MGIPAFLLYMVVLYDLRINKTVDSLKEMLSEFPEHAKEIAKAPAAKTGTTRQIMDHLLEREEWFPYFKKMLSYLGPQILLHEATDETPHLLSRVVELCTEDYVLEIYQQIAQLETIKQDACSAYVLPFRKAFNTRKFKVIEHLYSKGFEYDIQVDQAVCRSEHPLTYACYFFVKDTEDSINFTKAYLSAARNRKDCGIRRNSRDGDPDCVFCETVLESIVKSGRCDIMKLVIEAGGNVNAVTREGRTLVDIAKGDMKQLLLENGAKPTDPKEHLLYMSILGVKQQAPKRLKYIKELMETDSRHVRSINTETDILSCYHTVDLMLEAVAFSDVEALKLLLPAARSRLHSNQLMDGMKRAVHYCTYDIFGVNCGRIADMLRVLDESKVHFGYAPRQQTFLFTLQTMQDLLYWNRHAYQNEDETVADICYLLCKLFNQNPAKIFNKALANICRPDWGETTPPTEDIETIFISRGWEPPHLKKTKE